MVHKSSVILSRINEGKVNIGPFVYIGKDVFLGENVTIHPNVVIEDGVSIGDDVEIFPGAYIGKPVKGPALGSCSEYEKVLSIGRGCVIGSNVTLYYGDRIGEYTLISDGVSIRENVTIGDRCIIGRNATINYAARIGSHVKIMDLTHITAHVHIMDHAFIGPSVSTADDNGFGKDPAIPPEEIGGATIEENASVGMGAMLLPKVTIGKDSIVAAGALITKDVEAGALAMGFPAKDRSIKKEEQQHLNGGHSPEHSQK